MSSIFSLLLVVGFLTAWVGPVSANDGVFTGNPDRDWNHIRSNYLQSTGPGGECREESLYLEKDLQSAKSEYLSPLSQNGESMRRASSVSAGNCSRPGTRDGFFSPFSQVYGLAKHLDPILAVEPKEVACVAIAQKNFGGAGSHFALCPETGMKEKRAPRPCISENYATATAQAFNLVNECLGADSREMFKLFVRESGMALNSVSATGAVGISQMTGVAVMHVQDVSDGREGTEASRRLSEKFDTAIFGGGPLNPPNPYCWPLREIAAGRYTKSTASANCPILAMPEALFLPAYLGTKHYLYYKAELEAVARKDGFDRSFKGDYDEIMRTTAMYSFSAAGHYSVLPAFRALARASRASYRPGPKGRAEFLAKLKARLMTKRPKFAHEIDDYIDGDRKGEVVGVEDRYQSIKSKIGGAECF